VLNLFERNPELLWKDHFTGTGITRNLSSERPLPESKSSLRLEPTAESALLIHTISFARKV
jgi:hypothetical protein